MIDSKTCRYVCETNLYICIKFGGDRIIFVENFLVYIYIYIYMLFLKSLTRDFECYKKME